LLRAIYKKKEWIRDATQLAYQGETSADCLEGAVDSPDDIVGINESFRDVSKYIRFKTMIDMGLMIKPEDIRYEDYIVYTTVKLKLEELKYNGQSKTNL